MNLLTAFSPPNSWRDELASRLVRDKTLLSIPEGLVGRVLTLPAHQSLTLGKKKLVSAILTVLQFDYNFPNVCLLREVELLDTLVEEARIYGKKSHNKLGADCLQNAIFAAFS